MSLSHFSFTRSSADECALSQKNQESSAPLSYMTDSNVSLNKDACLVNASPFMQNPFKSIPSSIVDIESDLRIQTHSLSKCADSQFNPDTSKPINFEWKKCANDDLVPQYTRIDKPCNVFSGVTIDRFHPVDPSVQNLSQIQHNNYIGTNTRLQIKDAYRNSLTNGL